MMDLVSKSFCLVRAIDSIWDKTRKNCVLFSSIVVVVVFVALIICFFFPHIRIDGDVAKYFEQMKKKEQKIKIKDKLSLFNY